MSMPRMVMTVLASAVVTSLFVLAVGLVDIQIQGMRAGYIADWSGRPTFALAPRISWEFYIATALLCGIFFWAALRIVILQSTDQARLAMITSLTLLVVLPVIFMQTPEEIATDAVGGYSSPVVEWLQHGAGSPAIHATAGCVAALLVVSFSKQGRDIRERYSKESAPNSK